MEQADELKQYQSRLETDAAALLELENMLHEVEKENEQLRAKL